MKVVSAAASGSVTSPRGSGANNRSELSDVEFRSTRELYRFKKDFLDLLAEHFGGQTTLNHLRVGNFIGLCSQYECRPTSNLEIAQSLRLSRATVSRIVTDFIRCGWVHETRHPEDGRKRLLTITPDHRHADKFEREFRRHVNNLVNGHLHGKLVLVDPAKKSF